MLQYFKFFPTQLNKAELIVDRGAMELASQQYCTKLAAIFFLDKG
jgi:hypothetical protein